MLNKVMLVGTVGDYGVQDLGTDAKKFTVKTNKILPDGRDITTGFHAVIMRDPKGIFNNEFGAGDVVALTGELGYKAPKEEQRVEGMPGGLKWVNISCFVGDVAVITKNSTGAPANKPPADDSDSIPF